MQKIFFLSVIFVFVGLFGFALLAQTLSVFDITYPIAELGNCQDQASCKAYCDDLSNAEVCVLFAEKNGLEVNVEADQAKLLSAGGPGNCQSESECRAYCEDINHFDECISFAESKGFMAPAEAARAREQFNQTGPGGCRGANECRTYCEDDSHTEECLEFGHRQGLISDKDLEVARSVVKNGGPGGCRSPEECKAYCQDPSHVTECVDSAVQLGFLDEKEATRIKKFAVLEGPGGCVGEQCKTYCENPEHQTECIEFAESNGLMSPEEAELAKKFARKTGPGGCKGEECRIYCENPDHTEECIAFAEQEGLIPPEELQRAKKFLRATEQGGPGGCMGSECRSYCEDPAHQEECFQFAKGQGFLGPEEERQFEAGIKIKQKLEEAGGPGGCKSEDECRIYCSDPNRVEECVAFGAVHGGLSEEEVRQMLRDFTERKQYFSGPQGPQGFQPPEDFRQFEGQVMYKFEQFKILEQGFRGIEGGGFGQFQPTGAPNFTGPGGCTSPSECIKYCTEHKEECFSFGPPGQPGAVPPEGGVPPGIEFKPPEGFPDKGGTIPTVCPAMPTVDSCPPDQEKIVVFDSPGCGTYYMCRPKFFSQCPEGQYWDGQTCVTATTNQPTTEQSPTFMPDPATECAKNGGNWTGNNCEFPTKTGGSLFDAALNLLKRLFSK